MRRCMRTGVLTLAFLGGIAIAGAQTSQSTDSPPKAVPDPSQIQGTAQDRMRLSQDQQKKVSQGLSGHQQQAAPSGFDGQVGSKVPNSMQTQSVPNDVTAQVPETQGLLFVKLPDRVLLIDPNSKAVLEIVADISQPDSSGGGSNTQGSGTGTNR
jgi:hypothetical protein